MNRPTLELMPGDRVMVKSADEILRTLDEDGCLDSLPFMPEMLQYCGKEYRVYRRADKTCDTVNRTGGRRMLDTVHLESLRCDGSSHGGCQAACLLFWKEDWLQPATAAPVTAYDSASPDTAAIDRYCVQESDAAAAVYRCQATTLPEFTVLLHWWDVRQYARDLRTGNTTFGAFLRIMTLAGFRKLVDIGIGARALISMYNAVQRMRNGRPYPVVTGKLAKTPTAELNLQPGEYVRVRSLAEINETLDRSQKNRGLWFDQEMARYCGNTYRVKSRMEKIIDEPSGQMLHFGTPSVVLEGVFCASEFSSCRLFCPRSINSYWREIWLERIGEAGAVDSPTASSEAQVAQ